MNYNSRFRVLIIITAFLSTNCSILKNSDEKLFVIRDAYYQSWIRNENEKGTNIVVEVADLQPGISFDSIVFRGTRLQVFCEEKDGIVYLKSYLNPPLSVIQLGGETISKTDAALILFHYNGESQAYIIMEIRRLAMKYY
jgi:hypothetical protein